MGDAAMELTPEQLNEIADMVTTRVRAERPEIERTASGQLAIETPARPMVVLPPEFWELQAEFRAEVREGRARFEATEKRFEAMEKRFEAVDKRFEAVDQRFEDLIHYMDKRFEDMNRRFTGLQWGIGLSTTILVVLISMYQFLG